MLGLRHPNIVNIMGICSSPAAIVTEYCSRGSLHALLKAANSSRVVAAQLTWPRRLSMALGAAKGMDFLHRHNPPIIHRDLKSPNLMVDDTFRCKVGDFGLSKPLDNNSVASRGAATLPLWLAPEQLDHQHPMASTASDVHAYGIILWEILTWQQPFHHLNIHRVGLHVLEGGRPEVPPISELPGSDTPQFALHGLDAYLRLMRRCWAADPAARPTFQQVAAELRSMLEALARARAGSKPPSGPSTPSMPASTPAGSAPTASGGSGGDASGTGQCSICLKVAERRSLLPCGHGPVCAACAAALIGAIDGCPTCHNLVTGSTDCPTG